MCLEVKPVNGKYICHTAEKDIICWKHLVKTINGKLISTYYDFKYERGKRYSSKLELVENPLITRGIVNNGIHSFRNKESVIYDANDMISRGCYDINDADGETLICLKCKIPKGSKYYVGTFWEHDCYTSDTIIIGKREVKQ